MILIAPITGTKVFCTEERAEALIKAGYKPYKEPVKRGKQKADEKAEEAND